MALGIKDSSLVIPGRGTLFVAPKNTPLDETQGIKPFANINSDTITVGEATFNNFGHTSSENLFELAPDGGDATSLRTWLRENVKTIYDDISWALSGASVQWDKETLKQIYNAWDTADGNGSVVGAAKKSLEVALVLVANAGDGALGFYMPNASMSFGDGPSFDLQQFAEAPFTAQLQAAAPAALPASPDGRAGLFAIYGPDAFTA